VIERLGAPAVVTGHSMGASVALLAAERHSDAVGDLVLVDGGTPLPRSDDDPDTMLERTLGPAINRLGTIWPDRVSYQAMWARHPAFVEGIGPDLERNLLADLVEVDGGFRTAVDETAVRIDGADLFGDDEIATLLDRRGAPVTIVRAEFGLMGEPPPLIPASVRDRYPNHRWIEAPGLNHYTVLASPAGAALVANALRETLTSSQPG
jgi:lipase